MDFITRLKNQVLIMNGAMGTFFHGKYPRDMCLYELNFKMPELVNSVQEQYIKAGADFIECLTFSANRYKLKEFGLGNKTREINRAAVDIGRKLANEYSNVFVFASIGPLGQYIEPLGKLSSKQAYELYKEQVEACREADFIMFETFSDTKDMKAAILAAKDTMRKPIVMEVTFDNNLRTSTGTDPLTALNICQSLGVSVFGINCGLRPYEMEPIVEILVKKSKIPLIVQPNGGIPKLVNGKTVFESNPKEFAKYMKKFADLGINIVGACCGTTPEHVNEIKRLVADMKPVERNIKNYFMLSSRTTTVEFDNATVPVIIGERINPTNREDLQAELKSDKFSILINDAVQQSKIADCIDVNVGMPLIDEIKILKKAVLRIQEKVSTPLVIDTSNIKALEGALMESNGKVLVNSVTGEDRSLNIILPLAKRYGAAVIGLCIDENGIPEKAHDKVRIGKKIIEKCLDYGILEKDIIIDCVTMSVATNQQSAVNTLNAIEEFSRLGYNTVLGISNVSHGLPNRALLNSTFFMLAVQKGLSAAILNPFDASTKNSLYALRALMGKDSNCLRYINSQKNVKTEKREGKKKSIDEQLHNAVINGDNEVISDLVAEALQHTKPLKINNILVSALKEVGKEYKCENIFLPQVLASAEVVKKAFSILKEHLNHQDSKPKGTIMIATVKNDVHDIGKNIVIALLETQGYKIIDLGTNVDEATIVKEAKAHNAKLIALSALMTTTMTEMEKVIGLLKKENLKIPVIIGGAVVNQEYADEIGADYAKDALEAIEKVQNVLRG
ncbi:homocysteine S-methyltransferase family protein [Candidatus Woesearchaeota archaeon]|nr:homocysteine S-methyltransferase family protein [Candidatus Woesearchaeota archaeon]